MDTNPFAVSPNTQQAPSQPAAPSYLQQQSNPTVAGQISNMVKALVQGQGQFNQGQQLQQMIAAKNATAANPQTTNGMPSVGAPMSLAPPAPAMASSPTMSNMPNSPTAQPQMSNMPLNPSALAPSMSNSAPVNPASMTGDAFSSGTSPVQMDPMTAALFSNIPSAGGGNFGG